MKNMFNKRKKIILVFAFVVILITVFYLLATDSNYQSKYEINKNTFLSENFFLESEIVLNGINDEKKREYGYNLDYISMNYDFIIVPQNKKLIYNNLKAEIVIDEEINSLHVIPSENIIKSYVDEGVDIGYKLTSFGLSTGKTTWILPEVFEKIKQDKQILQKDLIINISWDGGSERIIFPKEYVQIIIN